MEGTRVLHCKKIKVVKTQKSPEAGCLKLLRFLNF